MSDYEEHLLSYLDPSRIMTLSRGHVIPRLNLLASPVVQTASGGEFDFTFEKRNSEKMVYHSIQKLKTISLTSYRLRILEVQFSVSFVTFPMAL